MDWLGLAIGVLGLIAAVFGAVMLVAQIWAMIAGARPRSTAQKRRETVTRTPIQAKRRAPSGQSAGDLVAPSRAPRMAEPKADAPPPFMGGADGPPESAPNMDALEQAPAAPEALAPDDALAVDDEDALERTAEHYEIAALSRSADLPGARSPGFMAKRDRTGIDEVVASLFAPPSCARGDAVRVQVFLHDLDDLMGAADAAREADPATRAQDRAQLLTELHRGAKITIALRAADAEGLEITALRDEIVWSGEPASANFSVEVAADARVGARALHAVVLLDGRPIGQLGFLLRVLAPAVSEASTLGLMGDPSTPHAMVRAKAFRSVFFSYAREDLEQVRVVARSFRAVTDDLFLDIESLEAGDDWRETIQRRIRSADLFVLCWSEAARASDMVRQEVAWALSANEQTGAPEIWPFPLGDPPPAAPWDSIAHLHIGDPIYYRALRQPPG